MGVYIDHKQFRRNAQRECDERWKTTWTDLKINIYHILFTTFFDENRTRRSSSYFFLWPRTRADATAKTRMSATNVREILSGVLDRREECARRTMARGWKLCWRLAVFECRMNPRPRDTCSKRSHTNNRMHFWSNRCKSDSDRDPFSRVAIKVKDLGHCHRRPTRIGQLAINLLPLVPTIYLCPACWHFHAH